MVRHPSEGNKIVAIYYIDDHKVEIYGYWDLLTPNGQYSYFDIYLNDSLDKLNEEPWYKPICPTKDEVMKKITQHFFED